MTSKYEEYIKPRIKDIEAYARVGCKDGEIANALGVSAKTFSKYKKTEPEVSKALLRGRQKAIPDVKDALYRRAVGYDYEESKATKRIEDGNVVEYVELYHRKMHPDVRACEAYLRNYDKNWSDRDNLDNSLREREYELRKMIADFKKEQSEW